MPASYTVTLTDAESDTIERLAQNTGRRPETILLHIMRNNLFRAVVSLASDEWSHYYEITDVKEMEVQSRLFIQFSHLLLGALPPRGDDLFT